MTESPARFIVVSCNSQHYYDDDYNNKGFDHFQIWSSIAKRNPTALIWAGDAIYADDFERVHDNDDKSKISNDSTDNDLSTVNSDTKLSFGLLEKKRVKIATPMVLQSLYNDLLNQEDGYQRVLRNNNVTTTILGAIDDHDYGANNGDQTYRFRNESMKLFVDFLVQSNEAIVENKHKQDSSNDNNSPAPIKLTAMQHRASKGLGIYGVQVWDYERPAGQELIPEHELKLDPYYDNDNSDSEAVTLSEKSVAIITLDVRSNKTPWNKDKHDKHELNYDADFLGEHQWEWLQQVIHRSTASVNIFVQGLQVHPDRFFNGNSVEDWSRFPTAQHRLYQLLLQSTSNLKAPIIVSGDVHMAEFLRKDCRQVKTGFTTNDNDSERVLLEVTTSGLTHSWGTHNCARPYLSWTCRMPVIDKGLRLGMHLAHHLWKDVMTLDSTQVYDNAKTGRQYSLDLNFGEFEMDWEKRQVKVRIWGQHGDDADPSLSTIWDFDQLSGIKALPPNPEVKRQDYEFIYNQLQSNIPVDDGDYICVPVHGRFTTVRKLFTVTASVSTAAMIALSPVLLPMIFACLYLFRKKKPTTKHTTNGVKHTNGAKLKGN